MGIVLKGPENPRFQAAAGVGARLQKARGRQPAVTIMHHFNGTRLQAQLRLDPGAIEEIGLGGQGRHLEGQVRFPAGEKRADLASSFDVQFDRDLGAFVAYQGKWGLTHYSSQDVLAGVNFGF